MKKLKFTITALTIVLLSFWVTILRNELNAVRNDKKGLEQEIKLKRDTIEGMYENDLQALEIINNYEKI
jgi:hypothetical protein